MASNDVHVLVTINDRLCYGCGDCIQRCPEGVLGFDEDDTNLKGVFPAMVVAPARCTGCRVCQASCRYGLINVEEAS